MVVKSWLVACHNAASDWKLAPHLHLADILGSTETAAATVL